jgi:hypothetical protein
MFNVYANIKLFMDKGFRERIQKQVYENEHRLYDIVREKF